MKNMTLDEFVEKVNSNTNLISKSDLRLSEYVSPRRIRDYVTKGLLDKPIKVGRVAYYNENHLEQVMEIRALHAKGLSDKSILGLKNETTIEKNISEADQSLKSSIFDEIQKIEGGLGSGKSQSLLRSLSLSATTLSGHSEKNACELNSKYFCETWNEYKISNKLQLKIIEKSSFSEDEIKTALIELENLLNTKKR